MGRPQKRKNKRNKISNVNNISNNLIENILFDLAAGISKSLISSKYGINIDTINKIFNKYHSRILDVKNSISQQSFCNPNIQKNNKSECVLDRYNIKMNNSRVLNASNDNSPNTFILKESGTVLLSSGTNIVSISSDLLTIPIEIDTYVENVIHDIPSNSTDNIPSTRIPVLSNVYLGMIKNRHNMPVNKFIFQSVSQKLMFDYDAQYTIAKEVILREIKFIDGEPQNVLVLYTTGLTCALATIIKVCDDLKINLILMHHNARVGNYEPQVIFNRFYHTDNVCPDVLKTVSRRKLYTFGCTAKEFVDNNVGYEIVETYIDKTTVNADNMPTENMYRDITLFTDRISAWKYYISLVEHDHKPINIFFNAVKIDNNKYLKLGTISSSKK